MKFLDLLAHYLLPRESNNHKAHILHAPSLSFIIIALLAYQLALQAVSGGSINVLGYSSNISVDEIIRLTNEKRKDAGLGPVSQDPLLTQAAQAKAADMINKNYWAHVAPDGTQPWRFFNDVGYKYRYAGENLARDFKDPGAVVNAWMASPSHRENMLSDRYKDIGLAVIDGTLTGTDTTLIVELFGRKLQDTIPVAPVAAAEPEKQKTSPTPLPTASPAPAIGTASTPEPENNIRLAGALTAPEVTTFDATRFVSLALTISLGVIIAIDAFIVARKKVVRISGRTLAHLSFLGMIIAIILIAKAGRIL